MFKGMKKTLTEKLGSVKKMAVVGGVAAVGAAQSQAAVAYETATNTFTGSIETGPFTSAVVIAVTLIGLIVAVGAGISAIRSAR